MTRAERELRAKATVHRAIPEILRSSPKAKHGISQADLIVDPQPVIKTPTGPAAPIYRPDLTIRVTTQDPLSTASNVSEKPYGAKRTADSRRNDDAKSNVTIHNMASLSRPGGAFLTGGNDQEAFLCARTTLFPSLYDEFYALPDIGGIFTPDVLVFRDTNAIDLPKRERYFINVISAGLPKHPENRGRYDEREASCSCGVSYCDRDRDIVVRKMKAVLRMAQLKGTKQLVLGAWGCGGSYRHPVKEVAKLWRKVIVGSSRQRRPNAEQWEGIDEIIFSIPDGSFAREFRHVFEDVLAPEYDPPSSGSATSGAGVEDVEVERLIGTATSLELQIETAQSSFVKGRLKEELREVNHRIALGRAAQASRGDDTTTEDEDVEDDYVVSGFPGSDGEDNSFYQLDGTTSDSESEGAGSEVYEFRFGAPDSQTSQDEFDELEETNFVGLSPSPHFDPQTGWYQGSIDELSAHVFNGKRKGSVSPRSPLVRTESMTGEAEADDIADGVLSRFQQTGVVEQS